MPAIKRRRSVGSRSRAASPTIPARIEASVPFPLCSSSIAPTTVTGGCAPVSAASSASIASVAIASPTSCRRRPGRPSSRRGSRGAKGGDDHSRSSPAGTTSRWPFRMRRRRRSRPSRPTTIVRPAYGPGPTPASRIELDAVREGDALDGHADPLELGGEHVLGALLGAGHARLAHERIEERERPVGAGVDGCVDGPPDGMVFRLGHFAECTTAGNGVGEPHGPRWVDQRATSCCEPRTRTPPENIRAYQPRSMRLIDTTRPVSGACTKRSPPT